MLGYAGDAEAGDASAGISAEVQSIAAGGEPLDYLTITLVRSAIRAAISWCS